MPDYRHHAPSVDLFTDDEHLVLCDWFGVDYARYERWIDDILDGWNIPNEIPEHRRIDAAVAQILLERVQDDLQIGLPVWATVLLSLDLFLTVAPFGRSSCGRAT